MLLSTDTLFVRDLGGERSVVEVLEAPELKLSGCGIDFVTVLSPTLHAAT